MVRAGDQVYWLHEKQPEDCERWVCEARCQLGRSGQTIEASPAWWPMINRRAALLTNRVWNATSSRPTFETRLRSATAPESKPLNSRSRYSLSPPCSGAGVD